MPYWLREAVKQETGRKKDLSEAGRYLRKNTGQNDRILLRMADGLAIMKKKGKERILWKRKEKTVPADHMLPAPIVPVSGVG